MIRARVCTVLFLSCVLGCASDPGTTPPPSLPEGGTLTFDAAMIVRTPDAAADPRDAGGVIIPHDASRDAGRDARSGELARYPDVPVVHTGHADFSGLTVLTHNFIQSETGRLEEMLVVIRNDGTLTLCSVLISASLMSGAGSIGSHTGTMDATPLVSPSGFSSDCLRPGDIALAYGNSSTLHRLDDVTRIEVTYSGFGGTAGYRTFAVVTHEAQSIVDPYGGGLYYAVQGTMRVSSGTIVNPDITVFPINTAGMPLDRIQDIELLTLRGPATWNYRTTGYEGTFTSYRYVTSYRSPSSVLPATPSDMEHAEQERRWQEARDAARERIGLRL